MGCDKMLMKISCIPSFVSLGCVEVGEKFMVVGSGVISTTKITLHQPELCLVGL